MNQSQRAEMYRKGYRYFVRFDPLSGIPPLATKTIADICRLFWHDFPIKRIGEGRGCVPMALWKHLAYVH